MSYDPFMVQPSIPSIKFPTKGDERDMVITEIGDMRQATDYETKLPAVWKSGNPKMQLRILVDYDNTDHALYVTEYTNLWKAIQAARKDAGAPLAPGGRLWIKYVDDVAVENNKLLKAKGYAAKYAPPAAPAADPFASSTVNYVSPQAELAAAADARPDQIPF